MFLATGAACRYCSSDVVKNTVVELTAPPKGLEVLAPTVHRV